jgi:hydroxylysine kinase
MSTEGESAVLKPGVKIKVETTEAQAKELALVRYGITTKEICELNSYDDRNFLIRADK